MQTVLRGALLCTLFVVAGCPKRVPTEPEPELPSVVEACDERQRAISQQADMLASPYGIDAHVDKNFKDRRVAWLMPEGLYQKYVVQTGAKNFGRCNDSGCFQFAAPASTLQKAIESSMAEGRHDPAVIGQALGLPAKNFEGPLRLVTLDLAATKTCARLPVEEDPGVWKCQSPEDKDCFKFGGYTSGGVPEIMVINAPVEGAQLTEVP